MHNRTARAVALAAVVTMSALAGCGSGNAVAPDSSQAAVPTIDAAAAVTPSPTPTPSVDPAQETAQVQGATEKFVTTVLTIGYPDKTFGDYTDRIEPLMTKNGFASLESADSIKKGSTALTSLYAQRARTAPKFSDDAEVTTLESTRATAQLAYENVAQQKSGSDWKTIKSLGTGSVTVQLVLDGDTWLIDDAS